MPKTTNPSHIRALGYIQNSGGSPLIEHFDDDHEPVGFALRESMRKAGLIKYDSNHGTIVAIPEEASN